MIRRLLVFCDIQNAPGLDKCYEPRPSVLVDNSYPVFSSVSIVTMDYRLGALQTVFICSDNL